MLDINDENNFWKCVCEIQKVFKNISSVFKSPHRSKLFFFSLSLQFLTLSALLHTSASLSACKRLHGSANYPLSMPSPLYPCYDSCPPFWVFLLPSPPSSSSIPPSLNFPLHSVRDRFCFCHNHHLICFGKYIVHIWRVLIDLYSVITPFSIVS